MALEDIVRLPGETMISFAKRRAAEMGLRIVGDEEVATEVFVQQKWDDDLVPEQTITKLSPEIQKERTDIDALLRGIDVLDAYNRWCKKMHPEANGKRESIMCSCPNPSHPDLNPSAWINLDLGEGGVWHCAACEMGGDKYDIAAWHFGLDVPNYKINDFPELRRMMAEDLGYTVMVQGKDEWLERVANQPIQGTTTTTENTGSDVPGVELALGGAPLGETSSVAVPGPVIAVTGQSEVLLSPLVVVEPEFAPGTPGQVPTLDWRTLGILPGTFLDIWLQVASQSYEPEEFYLWEGLMALATACGNNVIYEDTIPVRPNLMVCIIGTTGAGKSISISIFEKLIREAMPFTKSTGIGVRMIASPGSGEALLDQYQNEVVDPVTKQVTSYPVNGLYRESELASFVKRTGRNGNTMRELIMDLYDRAMPITAVSRGAGSVTAKDHFMQMITSTQPESIKVLMSTADAGAGFLNRWVYAFGSNKMRPARNAVRIDINPAVDSLRLVRAWAGMGQKIHFLDNTKAAEMWDDFYAKEVFPLIDQDNNWMAARLPLLAKKIMLLFAINDRMTEIQPRHVEALIKMWPYLISSYGLVGLNVGVDDIEECCNDIVRYLVDRPGQSFTVREISKQSAARKFRRETIVRAMDILNKGQFIDEVPRAKTEKAVRWTITNQTTPALSIVSNS